MIGGMTTTDPAQRCPFCHTPLSHRTAVCTGCRARRHVRTGMSPRGFRWYVATWALVSVPLVVLAFLAALLPWLPHGETPGYALALVGAKPMEVVPRCRVEVIDPSGKRTEAFVDGACGTPGTTVKTAPAPTAPDITTVRMAAAVHSLLTVTAALLSSWLLLRLLRRPFLQRSAPSWIRRAAA